MFSTQKFADDVKVEHIQAKLRYLKSKFMLSLKIEAVNHWKLV